MAKIIALLAFNLLFSDTCNVLIEPSPLNQKEMDRLANIGLDLTFGSNLRKQAKPDAVTLFFQKLEKNLHTWLLLNRFKLFSNEPIQVYLSEEKELQP
jgi:hypothetical protein